MCWNASIRTPRNIRIEDEKNTVSTPEYDSNFAPPDHVQPEHVSVELFDRGEVSRIQHSFK